jgi:hypothetical protein
MTPKIILEWFLAMIVGVITEILRSSFRSGKDILRMTPKIILEWFLAMTVGVITEILRSFFRSGKDFLRMTPKHNSRKDILRMTVFNSYFLFSQSGVVTPMGESEPGM